MCEPERVDVEPADKSSNGGVFLDAWGEIRCLWQLFDHGKDSILAGVPSEVLVEPIRQVMNRVSNGGPLTLRRLEAEFMLRPTAMVRSAAGMTPEWISKLEASSKQKKALYVYRCVAGPEPTSQLMPGDILLAVEGTPVTSLRSLERFCAHHDSVTLTVLRDGLISNMRVSTTVVDGSGCSNEVVIFNGLCLHATHSAVQQLGFLPQNGSDVFCSFIMKGSPGYEFSASAKWLLRVNSDEIRTLADVLTVAAHVKDREYVRLTMQCVFTGQVEVFTVKTDNHFFPVERFAHEGFNWQRSVLQDAAPHTAPRLKRQSSLVMFHAPQVAATEAPSLPSAWIGVAAAAVIVLAAAWARRNRH